MRKACMASAGLALLLGLGTGIAVGEEIVRDYDRSVDFKAYKTYSWLELETRPIFRAMQETVAEVSDADIESMIHRAVDEQLKKKGLVRKDEGAVDFKVSYFAVGTLDIEGTFYDAAPTGSLPYNHWRPFYEPTSDTRLNRTGTLTIDMVDPATSKLTWRGQASDTIKKTKDLEKTIKKVSKKILSKFPPK